MKKEKILVHYNKEEYSFVEKVIDWADKVAKNHTPHLTDFIDPRQLEIIRDVVNSYLTLTMFFYGGYQDAERVRVLIVPDYLTFNKDEMGLVIFQLDIAKNAKEIQHPDILGALLNIGLKRSKFGDILITDKGKYIVVAKEVSDYILLQLTKISSVSVTLSIIDTNLSLSSSTQYTEKTITVSSLRVDSIISALYNISRVKASEMIKKGMLKINYRVVDSIDKKLELEDMLSLRGFGRSKFFSEEKVTKKGKYRLIFKKII